MALTCHAVSTSRIKGHHAYNPDYFVGEEPICELEFTTKYSHNLIEVKRKNKDVTVGHVPEALAAILFPLRKVWKVYEIQAKITGKSQRAPERTLVLGGGIEIPCHYTIIGLKIHKKNCCKEKQSCKLYFYELYLYINYGICAINNKRREDLYTGGLYSGGKTREGGRGGVTYGILQ